MELKIKPTSFKAFITGSRAYGEPRKDSDIDLVIFLENKEDILILEQLADKLANNGTPTYSSSMYFGKLNLICMVEEEKFKIWKTITETFKCYNRPVLRQEAKTKIIAGGGS